MMSNRICGRCKSAKVVEIGSYCGTTYYRCENCQDWGEKDQFPEETLFARITASPEVLAEKLVYCSISGWTSALINFHTFHHEEAIAATVAKLMGVCDE